MPLARRVHRMKLACRERRRSANRPATILRSLSLSPRLGRNLPHLKAANVIDPRFVLTLAAGLLLLLNGLTAGHGSPTDTPEPEADVVPPDA